MTNLNFVCVSGIDSVIEYFTMFSFGKLSLIIGIIVALCGALLGVILVLKRYSALGNGLSFVGFGTLIFARILGITPLYINIPIMILVSYGLLKINENSKIKSDSAIALITTASMAIGVVLLSFTTGFSTDICNYMFGSILLVDNTKLYLTIILGFIVVLLYILFYNKIFTVTFDQNFAKATGVKTELYNILIAVLTALTIVLGMELMGTNLITAIIICPALSSMRLFKDFKSVVICSSIISVLCFVIGFIISIMLDGIATGACIVCVNVICFAIFYVTGFIKSAFAK